MTHKLPVVVMISGGGSNLQALIDTCQGDFPARIVAVVSNRTDAYGLQRAQAASIATAVIDHQDFANRQQFDTQLMTTIDSFQPELVLLAGFMRILTEAFVQHYAGKLINIHPSLLPLYPGLNTHQRALDNSDTRHGASIHFVTNELDGGPVVLQASVPVQPDDNAELLAARVLQQEHQIYPLVLHWIAQRRLILRNSQVILDGKVVPHPLQAAELGQK